MTLVPPSGSLKSLNTAFSRATRLRPAPKGAVVTRPISVGVQTDQAFVVKRRSVGIGDRGTIIAADRSVWSSKPRMFLVCAAGCEGCLGYLRGTKGLTIPWPEVARARMRPGARR